MLHVMKGMNQMLVYPATFEKGEMYIIVKFPDVPAAMTQGESYEQAYEKAIEVLCAVLEGYESYPSPSSIEDIQDKFPDKKVELVRFDPNSYNHK